MAYYYVKSENVTVGSQTTSYEYEINYDSNTERPCCYKSSDSLGDIGLYFSVGKIDDGTWLSSPQVQYYSIVEGEKQGPYPSSILGINDRNFVDIGIPFQISDTTTKVVTNLDCPYFENEEDAKEYVRTGDDSKALNYTDLHGTKVDFYLTNNGDRVSIKVVPQETNKPLKFDHAIYTFDAPLLPIYTPTVIIGGNNEFELNTTWDNLLNGYSQQGAIVKLVNTFDVDIDVMFNNTTVATLKATIKRGILAFETKAEIVVGTDNGYNLFVSTDNTFDDITTPSDDSSDATDGVNDGSTFGGFSNLTATYQMTKQAISDLGSFIWRNDFFDDITLLNNSPIENIVACHYMPVTIGGDNSAVVLGNVTTNVSGQRLGQNMKRINVASFTMPKLNTGFLGYEPYTSCSLYLPLFAMIELNPKDVCGYTISIDYVFDVVCGTFSVMVFTSKGGGKTMLFSGTGDCAISIPLTASNRSELQSSLLQSGVGLAGDVMTKNVGGAIGDVTNMALQRNHSTTFGSPSSMVGACSPNYVYYILRTPILNLPNNFAHTKGFICMQTYKMNSLKGFTRCSSDIDLSGINTTKEEKEMIKQALISGVYL